MEPHIEPRRGWHAVLPMLMVVGSQLSTNVGAAVAKYLFPLIGVEGVVAYRVGFSALILLAIFRPWRAARLDWTQRCNVAIYGVVIGMMNLLIYQSFKHIPIGVAVAIEVAGPLTVAVLSSHRARDFIAIAIAVTGLYFLLPLHGHAGQLDPVGVAYAAGAGVCWALYIVYGKRVSGMHGGQTVAWGMLAAAVFIVPNGFAHSGTVLFTPSYIAIGLAIAVMSSAIPYTMEMMALRRLPQRVFGMVSSGAPAISALAGIVILGEHLSLGQWLSILAIVLASAMTSLR
ncbi:EamA family transporter [Oxalobacteraceae bacterium A2-2]